MNKIAVLYAADRASAVALLRAREAELVAVYDASARGTIEKVSLAAHEGRFEILVVDALATFDPKPIAALRFALDVHDIGIEVLSASEPWLASSLPALRNGLEWIQEQEKAARTSAVQRGVEKAKTEGRRPGRPRRSIPPEAEGLVASGMSIGQAARTLGIPESSLRRSLSQLRQERLISKIATSSRVPEAA